MSSDKPGRAAFNAWGLTNLRPTRDIDLLGHTQNTVDAVLKIFRDVSKLETEPDGLEFDPLHIQGGKIKEEASMKASVSPCRRGSAKLGSTFRLTLVLRM